jgi:hypothetical protein
MSERLSLGLWGAVVGGTLGAPFRMASRPRRLAFYEPIPVRMEANEALDFWPLWLEHLEAGRGPLLLSHAYRTHAAVVSPELGFGAASLDDGLGAPLSGSLGNPLAEGAQALGRAVFWGLAFEGDREAAADWAWHDASIDHAWDGVWCAAFAADFTAQLADAPSVGAALKSSLARMPQASALHRAMPFVLKAAESPDRTREVIAALPAAITIPDASHAVITLATALSALLSAQGRFDRAVCTAAGCGGAADQAAILAGVWAALRAGEVPKDFTAPLGPRWVAGSTLRAQQPPTAVNTIVERLAAWQEANRPSEPEPEPEPEPEAAPVPEPAAEPAPEAEPAPDAELIPVAEIQADPAPEAAAEPVPAPLPKFPEGFDYSATELDGLEIRARFIRGPACEPGEAVELELQFINHEAESREIYPQLQTPSGWQIATRLASHRLEANGSSSFPAVIRPDAEGLEQGGRLILEVLGRALFIPVLPEAPWMSVGPFVNHDGAGFEREFPVEGKHLAGALSQGLAFNGRSDLPVKWQSASQFGPVHEVEKLFRTGPGVVFLWCKWILPKAGRFKVVCSASNGARVWVNRQRVISYHQEHVPHRRPTAPYVGEVDLAEPEAEIFIKLTRGNGEVKPLVFYMIDSEGRVAHPAAFGRMDP